MIDGNDDAAVAAALNALRDALLANAGADDTIDTLELRALVSGELEPTDEATLIERMGLSPELAARIKALQPRSQRPVRNLRPSQPVAGGPLPRIDPMAVTHPPMYTLDGPHGGRGRDEGLMVFGPGDQVEVLARPEGPMPHPPPISLWSGRRGETLLQSDEVRIQQDEAGVYRLLVPAEKLFKAEGEHRLMIVLGEDMTPSRAMVTESLVQILRAKALYQP